MTCSLGNTGDNWHSIVLPACPLKTEKEKKKTFPSWIKAWTRHHTWTISSDLVIIRKTFPRAFMDMSSCTLKHTEKEAQYKYQNLVSVLSRTERRNTPAASGAEGAMRVWFQSWDFWPFPLLCNELFIILPPSILIPIHPWSCLVFWKREGVYARCFSRVSYRYVLCHSLKMSHLQYL